MEEFSKLVKEYPEHSIILRDIYENIKHITHPDPVKYLRFALRTNIDLDKAKDFFIKVYGQNDN